MTAINTNVSALNARLSAIQADSKMGTAMERLSSGKRVNSAADDAAGLAVAGKMEAQLRGIKMATRNAQDGVGLIQTAESGLNEIRQMVLRLRELAVQMANGIYESADRENAQLEVVELRKQINLIGDNTRFNNVVLLGGGLSVTGAVIQAGPTTAEKITMKIKDMTTGGIYLSAISTMAVSTVTRSRAAMTALDTALSRISSELATLGSYQNRLEYSINNLSASANKNETALGRIIDADFAAETTNLSKQQILNQAATAMLAQANQSKANLISLLQ
jgi:flagellin